jgi:NAD(P)-dependent dehydrogenase (short-subunit alcohol dehydrogenase family)
MAAAEALGTQATWLVTGCSTGIGREIARAALARGHRVAVTARRPESVQDLAATHPDRTLALRLDVTDRAQIAAAVSETEARLGPIDVLVNNAGHGYMSALEEGVDEEVRRLFDTNFFGAVDMIKAVLPGMRRLGRGHVVNISSMTGLVTNPPNTYYSATKHALEAVTEGLAKEVASFGIRVTAVEPGAFRTDYVTRSMHETSTPIAAYADTEVGQRKTLIRAVGDKLPGDPRRLAEAVVMVTELDDPPLHLLLGPDVLAAFRKKLAAWEENLEAWEDVTKEVGFPPEEPRGDS